MSQIPHLLTPYLSLPRDSGSLTLLTSVLGASTNWLILRYLQSYLRPSPSTSPGDEPEIRVLLISFLRDAGFWREGARKLGVDLDKLAAKKRFAFIDGLSSLHLPSDSSRANDAFILPSPSLSTIRERIAKTIATLSTDCGSGKVVLIVDQLDVLLATSAGDGKDGVSTGSVGEMMMELRQDVHSTILTLSADTPLVVDPQAPLEVDHAALLMGIAHQADLVIGLRLLDTGTAKDVGGVLRVSVRDGEEAEERRAEEIEKELLFRVEANGGVKVFERGT